MKVLLFFVMLLGFSFSSSAQTETKSESTTVTEAPKVQMYYFHYTRRCETCKAVESVSKETVANLYGNKVSFAEVNLDEKEGKKIGKKLGVYGQTLIIIAGDQKIDITNDGFMNARNNPEKLKAIIKEKIDAII